MIHSTVSSKILKAIGAAEGFCVEVIHFHTLYPAISSALFIRSATVLLCSEAASSDLRNEY